MNDIIKLPQNARTADFTPFAEAGEVIVGAPQATDSGRKYVEAPAGSLNAGDVAVRFVQVQEGTGRRSSWQFVGWRKVVIGTVTGAGKVFQPAYAEYEDRQRFYFGE